MLKDHEFDRGLGNLPDEKYRRHLQAKKREIEFIIDEELCWLCNQYLLSVIEVASRAAESGIITAEKASLSITQAEDFFMGLPEARRRLKYQDNSDGWLAIWLSNHPEYLVQNDLTWPNWLSASHVE